MKLNNRRGFIGAAATLTTVSTFGIRRASAAPAFEYKYGTNVPVTHPLTARALEAAEKIRKESDGRFELKVFPNNQLGGDNRHAVSGAQRGARVLLRLGCGRTLDRNPGRLNVRNWLRLA